MWWAGARAAGGRGAGRRGGQVEREGLSKPSPADAQGVCWETGVRAYAKLRRWSVGNGTTAVCVSMLIHVV